jgi:hypothetical protein
MHGSPITHTKYVNVLICNELMGNNYAAATAAAAVPAWSLEQPRKMELAMCMTRTLPGPITCITPMTRV